MAGYIPGLGYHILTGWYDRVVALAMPEREFRRRTLGYARLAPGMRILDAGCGTGTLLAMLPPDIEAHGADIDEKMLATARRKAPAARLCNASLLGLPYPKARFDRVLSSFVLHHLRPAGKIRAFREIARVLKPGGEFLLADWGPPAGPLQSAAFLTVQLLDGFATTQSHRQGRVPELLRAGGFATAEELGHMRLIAGTVRFWRAIPVSAVPPAGAAS
jgi:ubiquinone/menaquinone biosynthesis C-methylase UbiE